KNLKTFVLAVAIMISGSILAAKEKPVVNKNSNSYELAKLLEDQTLNLDKDYLGKVVFSVNEDREIVLHAVMSKEEFARDYITSKLSDKVLNGNNWVVGKIYHLPVRMKMKE